ncbi:MAG: dTDP-4-amino-4,6-dideoxygalactose transaminase [Pseudomonadota bacterium]
MINKPELTIPFNKPFIAGNELAYIHDAVIANKRISGGGYFTERCHSWLTKHLGNCAAFLTNSCTSALEMSAIMIDIQPGDEVIMPSFTFVSTANAFALRGAKPVFVDIRKDTLNIDENLIPCAITSRTRAIVPVHYAGVACEMDSILETAQANGLIVVEDAAQAMLSTYKGKSLGAIGHIGCLSFHETKNIISGEGGAVLINNDSGRDLMEKAGIIWEKGTNRKDFSNGLTDRYTWIRLGSSFLPSEIGAAFLLAQLECAHSIVENRRALAGLYYRFLKPLEVSGCVRLPKNLPNASTSNGHMFYILTSNAVERGRLIQFLARRGISALFHYIPLHSSPAGKKYGRIACSMNVTDNISERLLRLPLYYEMEPSDIEAVSVAIHEFYLG